MVITMSGKVVESKLRTCKGPPLSGLCIDLVGAVSTVFRARSKEEKAAMWAKVSQEETIGYVLGDLLDHPPLSAGEARTLGNVVRQRAGAAEQKEKADVKEARRLPTGPVREKAVAAASSAVHDAAMEGLPLPAARSKSKLSASVIRALPAAPVSAADPALAPTPAPTPAPKHGPTPQALYCSDGAAQGPAETRVLQ